MLHNILLLVVAEQAMLIARVGLLMEVRIFAVLNHLSVVA